MLHHWKIIGARFSPNDEILTFGRPVFAQQNRKLGEDTHVCALQTQASFQKGNDFVEMAATFVHLDERIEFFLR